MKTTENISLAGYAFVIESDAYNDLESYLNDIREAFNNDSSAEEIVADIEERIAELLKDTCIDGTVVDQRMVNDIKKRIGYPKELAQEELAQEDVAQEDVATSPAAEVQKRKRLYRNMDERVFGGVCSGLGAFFGIDKVFFRIIFLLIFFIGFFGWNEGTFLLISCLTYIGLWISMPAARTAEQKREMKGKPLNLRNYRDSDFDFKQEMKEAADSPGGKTMKRAGGATIGILLLAIGLLGLLGCIFMPSLPNTISNHFNAEILRWGSPDTGEQLGMTIATSTIFWGLILVMSGIFSVWFLYNGVMLIFGLKFPSWRPGLILFIAWIISIFAIAGWVAKTVAAALPMIV